MRITHRCICTPGSLASWCRISVWKANLEFLSRNRANIDLMMEAESTSDTSVNYFETTRRNIPRDSHLQCHLLITTIPCTRFDDRRSKQIILSSTPFETRDRNVTVCTANIYCYRCLYYWNAVCLLHSFNTQTIVLNTVNKQTLTS
jgi:hypothetical protein